MGIFNFLKKEKKQDLSIEDKILEGAESSEVVIPIHAKPKTELIEEVALVHKKDKKAFFKVIGVYDIGTEVMVSGVVQSGVLVKKMKTKINEKDALISDIKRGSDKVKELTAAEEGKIFLKGKNLFTIKQNDVLEFK